MNCSIRLRGVGVLGLLCLAGLGPLAAGTTAWRVGHPVDPAAGTVAADLIATPDNPLEDVQALHRVMFVMKDGKVIRNDR